MKIAKLKNLGIGAMVVILSLTYSGNSLAQNKLSKKEKKQGWELLFNGKDFTGWRGVNKSSFPDKGWTVEDGTIKCTSEGGGSIITQEKYSDFELEWEWKLTNPGANTGLKYYVNERPGDTGGYGYGVEFQLVDNQEENKNSVGAAYDILPAVPGTKAKTVGEWNLSRIVSKDGKVEHWLNGDKVLEYDRFSDEFKKAVANSKFRKEKNFGMHEDGHILLQDHGNVVYFKNLKLKQL
jgi:hypothetical protein